MSTSGCCQISLSGFVLFFFVCFSFDDFLRLFTCNKLITALATLIFSHLYKCETDDSWVFLLNLFRLMMFLLSFFVLLACKSLGFETSLWFYRSFRFLLNFRFSSFRHLLVTRMFPLLMLLFVFVWLIQIHFLFNFNTFVFYFLVLYQFELTLEVFLFALLCF